MKNIYPKNKELFKELIPFAKKIMSICEKNNVRVIFASTCCCYGDNKLEVSNETSEVWPTEPYSQSKRSIELKIYERNKKIPDKMKTVVCSLGKASKK